MPLRLPAVLLLTLLAAAAELPLPELRIEPTPGGSLFIIKNASPQPLTAYLIEMVDYLGSSYALWQDDVAEPIGPGGEKCIQITDMTVGAVPDYVKMQAALYADGASSGVSDKVKQLIERRRSILETTRELIGRLEKAPASKATALADLKQWMESTPAPTRANRNSQLAINQAASKSLIAEIAARIEAHSVDDALTRLRASERALAASKPAL